MFHFVLLSDTPSAVLLCTDNKPQLFAWIKCESEAQVMPTSVQIAMRGPPWQHLCDICPRNPLQKHCLSKAAFTPGI